MIFLDTFKLEYELMYLSFISMGFIIYHLKTQFKWVCIVPCMVSIFNVSAIYMILILYAISTYYHHKLINKNMSLVVLVYMMSIVYFYMYTVIYVWWFSYFMSLILIKFIGRDLNELVI